MSTLNNHQNQPANRATRRAKAAPRNPRMAGRVAPLFNTLWARHYDSLDLFEQMSLDSTDKGYVPVPSDIDNDDDTRYSF